MKSFEVGNWPGWEEYKVAIMSRFEIGPFDYPLAEFTKLKKNRSVAQY